MTSDFDEFRSRIRQVLLEDWDPHNAASRLPVTLGAYDTYVEPLAQLIEAGSSEDAIIDFLIERERESMCFPPLGRERLRNVARKLVALRVQISR